MLFNDETTAVYLFLVPILPYNVRLCRNTLRLQLDVVQFRSGPSKTRALRTQKVMFHYFLDQC